MTRKCNNCGFENQDDYDYCAKCGIPLVEGMKPKQFYVYKAQPPKINKRNLLISYLVTIFLSWGGVVLWLFSKSTGFTMFTFFGFFMPFYLVQSKHPEIKKHGIIQLIISLIGVGLSFYLMFKK